MKRLWHPCDKGGHVRDFHGGGLDAAIARFGGRREDWIDLSRDINSRAWPVPAFPFECWTKLPDMDDSERLIEAACRRWSFLRESHVVFAPGVSSL